MANPIPVYVEVFCTYCQIDGHEVVNCHAMYHYLSNILIATEMDTRKADQGTQPEVIKKTLCVAHWGQSKKAATNARSLAAANAHGAFHV